MRVPCTRSKAINSSSEVERLSLSTYRSSGSGLIVGKCELVESRGPFTLSQLKDRQDKHAVPLGELRPFLTKYKDQAHAWVLERVVAFEEPIPYSHPSGAVIWVTLPDDFFDAAKP